MILALLLIVLPGQTVFALGPSSIEGRAADTSESDLVRQMKDRLKDDPEIAAVVAQRILKSSLGPQFTKAANEEDALKDLKEWVNDNPEAAAHLAIGFAKDDASGKKIFENSLYKDMENFLELNPDSSKGMFGRLKRASKFAGSMEQMEDLDNEDRQAVINALFEGVDSQRSGKLSRTDNAGRWAQQKGIGPGGTAGPGERVDASAQLYDRLGSGNVTGYSPDVMTLQSELNRRKAPGAPNLIETGKLDYPTLRHPYYGLRYDIDRLTAAMRLHRAWSIARTLGKEYSQKDLANPKIQAELEQLAAEKGEDPGFARRLAALEKAENALAAFDREANKTKRHKGITRGRINKLSSLRQDAARWIAIASLEETIQRLSAQQGFMTQPLRAAVAQVPVAQEERSAFLNAGTELERQLKEGITKGLLATALLSGGPENWAEAQKLSGEVRAVSKRLPRVIQNYRDAPLKAAEGTQQATGWRVKIDELMLEYLPNLAYSKRLKRKRDDAENRVAAFLRFAKQAR
ncbi:MAG: hypothetical protein COB53_00030 [Elusimicrobia bacterium]|nr:MAG: hypothetical protein COB53_00030 [Elusimicrobiota bacterium]